MAEHLGLTLTEAIGEYLAWLEFDRHASPHTVAAYRRDLEYLADYGKAGGSVRCRPAGRIRRRPAGQPAADPDFGATVSTPTPFVHHAAAHLRCRGRPLRVFTSLIPCA